ncbi:MAG: preprotein translocase subunit SecA [Peptostreptococcaceae bacterium]
MAILKQIFDVSDKVEIKKLTKIVDEIESLEPKISLLNDEELKNMTNIFKERLDNGQTLDDILVEAFAVAREASKRVLGMTQYPVQLIGGIVLHQGKIAEMKTGEGKTLVGVAPVYLNALTGKGVHVVTVNDYLAKRDKELMEPVYNFLGLSVGVIVHGQEPPERRAQYQCDITYGTNNEFGFDYLKDNMVTNIDDMVQRELNYAIVDEVDSILVDEARTPLIISGPMAHEERDYRMVNVFIKMLLDGDFTYDEKDKTIALTDEGISRAEWFFQMDNLMDVENIQTYHFINQALRAFFLMHRDKDYVVRDGKVEIVDEFTGRVMDGRRYSDGLHQAIEAKENVEIKEESKTLATITYQNLFRMYKKLSGMTGTAKTEETEFESIYKMSVIQIPTNKPVIRKDLDDKLYKTEISKFEAIIKDIEAIHKTGQPILVGTATIEKSEVMSYLLTQKKLKHEVLNAKNHEKEAEIISKAGQLNSITIATNMAGRGTDIGLGEGVASLGGLYVIGTEKHENRRIDNQLKGRSGRQGDPGTSQFYVSLEDDLMRLFSNSKVKKIGEGMDENDVIEHKVLTKAIESSQKNIESKNFEIRKHVLQYDDIINRQRNLVYADRRKVLFGEDLSETIESMVRDVKEDYELAMIEYKEKEEAMGHDAMRDYERKVLLNVIDTHWVDHIDGLDQLKKVIGLMAAGQKDPLKEYTVEAFDMFEAMSKNIKHDTVMYLYR